MKKSDLKGGMVVKTKNGFLYLVAGNMLLRDGGWTSLDNYDDDLNNKYKRDIDIIEIYDDYNPHIISRFMSNNPTKSIWKREE